MIGDGRDIAKAGSCTAGCPRLQCPCRFGISPEMEATQPCLLQGSGTLAGKKFSLMLFVLEPGITDTSWPCLRELSLLWCQEILLLFLPFQVFSQVRGAETWQEPPGVAKRHGGKQILLPSGENTFRRVASYLQVPPSAVTANWALRRDHLSNDHWDDCLQNCFSFCPAQASKALQKHRAKFSHLHDYHTYYVQMDDSWLLRWVSLAWAGKSLNAVLV